MLGKLLKYDLKSMFKVFVPLWLAVLAVSIINHFTANSASGNGLPTVLFMMVYVGLIIAVIVMSMVLVIMRFYHGLLKDEGYLMFTLPVKTWQLISSKTISATIITIISCIVGFLSVMFIAADEWFYRGVFDAIRAALSHMTGEMFLTVFLSIALIICATIIGIMHIYAALACGHLANSRRIGWAVLAYIGIYMIGTTVISLVGKITQSWNIHFWINELTTLANINAMLGLCLLFAVIVIAALFVLTERILSKRLNLE